MNESYPEEEFGFYSFDLYTIQKIQEFMKTYYWEGFTITGGEFFTSDRARELYEFFTNPQYVVITDKAAIIILDYSRLLSIFKLCVFLQSENSKEELEFFEFVTKRTYKKKEHPAVRLFEKRNLKNPWSMKELESGLRATEPFSFYLDAFNERDNHESR